MGKKKKRAVEKLWCYYCDREFDEEEGLVQHQKAKHFKCHVCHKKHSSAGGMVTHALQIHKEAITKVPHALPDRESTEIEICGMRGIPDGFLAARCGEGEDDSFKFGDVEAPSDGLVGGGVPGSFGAPGYHCSPVYSAIPPMYSPASGWRLPVHAPAPYPWYPPASGWPHPVHAPYPWYSQPPVAPVPPLVNDQQPLFRNQGGRPHLASSATIPALYPGYSVGAPGLPSVPQPLSPVTSVNANLPNQSVASSLASMSSTVLPSSSTDLKDKADVTVNVGPSPVIANDTPASQLAINEVYLFWVDEAMSMEERRLSLPKYQLHNEMSEMNSMDAAADSRIR